MPRKLTPFITKYAATIICVSLFSTNVLWAHAPEVNFWAERKKAQSQVSIFDQLPRTNVPNIENLKYGKLNASLNLPLQFGTVRKILKPQSPSLKSQIIIHIQDIHLNPEAQANIGKAIRALIEQEKIGLVALEGAFSPIDFSIVHKFPYPDSVRAVADYLLKEKKISGPVHAVLTSDGSPLVVGIDDKEHYRANVEAYRQSAPLVQKYKQDLQVRKKEIDERKLSVFSSQLSEFDGRIQAYRAGTISFGDYVRSIFNQSGNYLASQIFLQALGLERSLNFSQVESQRAQLISQLTSQLTQKETSDLVQVSTAYRLGNVRNSEFYDYLKNLCRKHRIDLNRYRAMEAYIQYVLLADTIDVEKVLEEAKNQENAAYEALAKTDVEKQLVRESKQIFLTGKLLDFALTREEWNEYRVLCAEFCVQRTRNNKFNVRPFEMFYEKAEIRDDVMAQNLISSSRSTQLTERSTSVLVTGGFHSSGIDKKLVEAGYTVISFVPKITKIDTENGLPPEARAVGGAKGGSAYLSVFTQEKTPLDQLFEGEKLFLSPPQSPNIPRAIAQFATLDAGLRHPNVKIEDLANEALDFTPTNTVIDQKHRTAQMTMPDGSRLKAIQYEDMRLRELTCSTPDNKRFRVVAPNSYFLVFISSAFTLGILQQLGLPNLSVGSILICVFGYKLLFLLFTLLHEAGHLWADGHTIGKTLGQKITLTLNTLHTKRTLSRFIGYLRLMRVLSPNRSRSIKKYFKQHPFQAGILIFLSGFDITLAFVDSKQLKKYTEQVAFMGPAMNLISLAVGTTMMCAGLKMHPYSFSDPGFWLFIGGFATVLANAILLFPCSLKDVAIFFQHEELRDGKYWMGPTDRAKVGVMVKPHQPTESDRQTNKVREWLGRGDVGLQSASTDQVQRLIDPATRETALTELILGGKSNLTKKQRERVLRLVKKLDAALTKSDPVVPSTVDEPRPKGSVPLRRDWGQGLWTSGSMGGIDHLRKGRKPILPALRTFVANEVLPRLSIVSVDDLDNIVELMAGDGQLFELALSTLKDRFPNITLPSWILTDWHDSYLKEAGSGYVKRTKKVNVLEKLPFEDESLKAIVCLSGLDVIPLDKLPAILAEISRVLEPGGSLVAMLDVHPQWEVQQDAAAEKGQIIFPHFSELMPGVMGPFGIIFFDWSHLISRLGGARHALEKEYLHMFIADPYHFLLGAIQKGDVRNSMEVMSQKLQSHSGSMARLETSFPKLHMRQAAAAAERVGLKVEHLGPIHNTYVSDRSMAPGFHENANVIVSKMGFGHYGNAPYLGPNARDFKNPVGFELTIDLLHITKPGSPIKKVGGASDLLHLILSLKYKPGLWSFWTLFSVLLIEAPVLWLVAMKTGPPLLLGASGIFIAVALPFLFFHFFTRLALYQQGKISGRSIFIGTLSDLFILGMYLTFANCADPNSWWIYSPILIQLIVDAVWIRQDLAKKIKIFTTDKRSLEDVFPVDGPNIHESLELRKKFTLLSPETGEHQTFIARSGLNERQLAKDIGRLSNLQILNELRALSLVRVTDREYTSAHPVEPLLTNLGFLDENELCLILDRLVAHGDLDHYIRNSVASLHGIIHFQGQHSEYLKPYLMGKLLLRELLMRWSRGPARDVILGEKVSPSEPVPFHNLKTKAVFKNAEQPNYPDPAELPPPIWLNRVVPPELKAEVEHFLSEDPDLLEMRRLLAGLSFPIYFAESLQEVSVAWALRFSETTPQTLWTEEPGLVDCPKSGTGIFLNKQWLLFDTASRRTALQHELGHALAHATNAQAPRADELRFHHLLSVLTNEKTVDDVYNAFTDDVVIRQQLKSGLKASALNYLEYGMKNAEDYLQLQGHLASNLGLEYALHLLRYSHLLDLEGPLRPRIEASFAQMDKIYAPFLGENLAKVREWTTELLLPYATDNRWVKEPLGFVNIMRIFLARLDSLSLPNPASVLPHGAHMEKDALSLLESAIANKRAELTQKGEQRTINVVIDGAVGVGKYDFFKKLMAHLKDEIVMAYSRDIAPEEDDGEVAKETMDRIREGTAQAQTHPYVFILAGWRTVKLCKTLQAQFAFMPDIKISLVASSNTRKANMTERHNQVRTDQEWERTLRSMDHLYDPSISYDFVIKMDEKKWEQKPAEEKVPDKPKSPLELFADQVRSHLPTTARALLSDQMVEMWLKLKPTELKKAVSQFIRQKFLAKHLFDVEDTISKLVKAITTNTKNLISKMVSSNDFARHSPKASLLAVPLSKNEQDFTGLFDAAGDLAEIVRSFLDDVIQGNPDTRILDTNEDDFEWELMFAKRWRKFIPDQDVRVGTERSAAPWYVSELLSNPPLRRNFVRVLRELSKSGEKDPQKLLELFNSDAMKKIIEQDSREATKKIEQAWAQDPGFFGWFISDTTKRQVRSFLHDLLDGRIFAPTIGPLTGLNLAQWKKYLLGIRCDHSFFDFMATLAELYLDYSTDVARPLPFDLSDPVLLRHLLMRLESPQYVSYQSKISTNGGFEDQKIQVFLSRLPVLFRMMESGYGLEFGRHIKVHVSRCLQSADADNDFITAVNGALDWETDNANSTELSKESLQDGDTRYQKLADQMRKHGFFLHPYAGNIPRFVAFHMYRLLNPAGENLVFADQPLVVVEALHGTPEGGYGHAFTSPESGGPIMLLSDRAYELAAVTRHVFLTNHYEGGAADTYGRAGRELVLNMHKQALDENPKINEPNELFGSFMINAAIHESVHGAHHLADEGPSILAETAFGRIPFIELAERAQVLKWPGETRTDALFKHYRRSTELAYRLAGAEAHQTPLDQIKRVLSDNKEKGSLQQRLRLAIEEESPVAHAYYSQDKVQKAIDDLEQVLRKLRPTVRRPFLFPYSDNEMRENPALPNPAAIGYLLVTLFFSGTWAKIIGAIIGLTGVNFLESHWIQMAIANTSGWNLIGLAALFIGVHLLLIAGREWKMRANANRGSPNIPFSPAYLACVLFFTLLLYSFILSSYYFLPDYGKYIHLALDSAVILLDIARIKKDIRLTKHLKAVRAILAQIKTAEYIDEIKRLAKKLGKLEDIDFMDLLTQIEQYPGHLKKGITRKQQVLDHAKKFLELFHATFDENGVPEGVINQPTRPDIPLRSWLLELFPLERLNKGIQYIRALFKEEGESPVVSLNGLQTILEFQQKTGIEFDVYGVLEYMGITPDKGIQLTRTRSFKRRQFIEKLMKSGYLYVEGEETPGTPLTFLINSSGNAIQGLLHEVKILVEKGIPIDGKTYKLPNGSKVVMVAHDTLSPAKKDKVEKNYGEYSGGVFFLSDFIKDARELGMYKGEDDETVKHRLEDINELLSALDTYVDLWNKKYPDKPKMHVRASNEESALVGGASILRNAREQLQKRRVEHIDYIAMGRGGGGPVAGMALEAHYHEQTGGEHTEVWAVGSEIPTVSLADGQAIQNAQSWMQRVLRAFPKFLKSSNVNEAWFYKATADMYAHTSAEGLPIQVEPSAASGLAKLYSIMADPNQWHLLRPGPDDRKKVLVFVLSGNNFADYVPEEALKVSREENMEGAVYIFRQIAYRKLVNEYFLGNSTIQNDIARIKQQFPNDPVLQATFIDDFERLKRILHMPNVSQLVTELEQEWPSSETIVSEVQETLLGVAMMPHAPYRGLFAAIMEVADRVSVLGNRLKRKPDQLDLKAEFEQDVRRLYVLLRATELKAYHEIVPPHRDFVRGALIDGTPLPPPATRNPGNGGALTLSSTIGFTKRVLNRWPMLKEKAFLWTGATGLAGEDAKIERVAQRLVSWWYEILPGGWRIWESSLLPWFVLFHNNKGEDGTQRTVYWKFFFNRLTGKPSHEKFNWTVFLTRLFGHILFIYPLTASPFIVAWYRSGAPTLGTFINGSGASPILTLILAVFLHALGHFLHSYFFPKAALTMEDTGLSFPVVIRHVPPLPDIDAMPVFFRLIQENPMYVALESLDSGHRTRGTMKLANDKGPVMEFWTSELKPGERYRYNFGFTDMDVDPWNQILPQNDLEEVLGTAMASDHITGDKVIINRKGNWGLQNPIAIVDRTSRQIAYFLDLQPRFHSGVEFIREWMQPEKRQHLYNRLWEGLPPLATTKTRPERVRLLRRLKEKFEWEWFWLNPKKSTNPVAREIRNIYGRAYTDGFGGYNNPHKKLTFLRDFFYLPMQFMTEYITAIERGDVNPSDGQIERMIQMAIDTEFILYLSLLSLRIWDEGDPDENLETLRQLLTDLEKQGSGQRFFDSPISLLDFGTSMPTLVSDDTAYLRFFDKINRLSPENRRQYYRNQLGHIGRHLRSFYRSGPYPGDYRWNAGTENTNTTDYICVMMAIRFLLAEVESGTLDTLESNKNLEAVLQGLSGNPHQLTDINLLTRFSNQPQFVTLNLTDKVREGVVHLQKYQPQLLNQLGSNQLSSSQYSVYAVHDPYQADFLRTHLITTAFEPRFKNRSMDGYLNPDDGVTPSKLDWIQTLNSNYQQCQENRGSGGTHEELYNPNFAAWTQRELRESLLKLKKSIPPATSSLWYLHRLSQLQAGDKPTRKMKLEGLAAALGEGVGILLLGYLSAWLMSNLLMDVMGPSPTLVFVLSQGFGIAVTWMAIRIYSKWHVQLEQKISSGNLVRAPPAVSFRQHVADLSVYLLFVPLLSISSLLAFIPLLFHVLTDAHRMGLTNRFWNTKEFWTAGFTAFFGTMFFVFGFSHWNAGFLSHGWATAASIALFLYFGWRLVSMGVFVCLCWFVTRSSFSVGAHTYSLITPVALLVSLKEQGTDTPFLPDLNNDQVIHAQWLNILGFLPHHYQWLLYRSFVLPWRVLHERPAQFTPINKLPRLWRELTTQLLEGGVILFPTVTHLITGHAGLTLFMAFVGLGVLLVVMVWGQKAEERARVGNSNPQIFDNGFPVKHMMMAQNRLAVVGQNDIKLWWVPTQTLRKILPVHSAASLNLFPNPISTLRLKLERFFDEDSLGQTVIGSDDNKWLAMSEPNGQIKIFYVEHKEKEKPIYTLQARGVADGATSVPIKLAVSSSNEPVVATFHGNEVDIYLGPIKLPLRTFSHVRNVQDVALSKEGRFLLVTCGKEVYVWDVLLNRLVNTFQTNTVMAKVEFSEDDHFAMAATLEGQVYTWNLNRVKPLGKGWMHHQRLEKGHPRLPEEIYPQLGDAPHEWLLAFTTDATGMLGVGHHPEMGYGAEKAWWGGKKKRPGPLHEKSGHSGLDFVTVIDEDGAITPIPHGTPARAMFDGRVIAKYDDEMATTFIVTTGVQDHQGREMILQFGHIKPENAAGTNRELNIGDEIKKGEIIGRIVPSRNPNSSVSAHLHKSVGFMRAADFQEFNREDMSNQILDGLIMEGVIELFNPLDLFEPEDIDCFEDYRYPGLNNILIVLTQENGEERKIDAVRQIIGPHYPGVEMPGAKTPESWAEHLDDATERLNIQVIVTNDLSLEQKLRDQYPGQLDHIAFVCHQSLGGVGVTNSVRHQLLEDIKYIQRLGPLHNAPVEKIIKNTTRQKVLTMVLADAGVVTLRQLLDAVDNWEPIGSLDEWWDILQILANKIPNAIRYPSLLARESWVAHVTPRTATLERVVALSLNFSSIEIFLSWPRDPAAYFFQPIVRLLPFSISIRILFSCLPKKDVDRLAKLMKVLDQRFHSIGDLIRLITHKPHIFESIFPDQKDQWAVYLALFRVAPWLISYQIRTIDRLASADEKAELGTIVAENKIPPPYWFRRRPHPSPSVVISPSAIQSGIKAPALFGNKHPIVLFINSQGEEDLLDVATQTPRYNFIGIEQAELSVGRLAGIVEENGLHNVLLAQGDHQELLNTLFEDGSIASIYILFPEFEMTDEFCALLIRKLRKGGYIHIRTPVTNTIDEFDNPGIRLFTRISDLRIPNIKVSFHKGGVGNSTYHGPPNLQRVLRPAGPIHDVFIRKPGNERYTYEVVDINAVLQGGIQQSDNPTPSASAWWNMAGIAVVWVIGVVYGVHTFEWQAALLFALFLSVIIFTSFYWHENAHRRVAGLTWNDFQIISSRGTGRPIRWWEAGVGFPSAPGMPGIKASLQLATIFLILLCLPLVLFPPLMSSVYPHAPFLLTQVDTVFIPLAAAGTVINLLLAMSPLDWKGLSGKSSLVEFTRPTDSRVSGPSQGTGTNRIVRGWANKFSGYFLGAEKRFDDVQIAVNRALVPVVRNVAITLGKKGEAVPILSVGEGSMATATLLSGALKLSDQYPITAIEPAVSRDHFQKSDLSLMLNTLSHVPLPIEDVDASNIINPPKIIYASLSFEYTDREKALAVLKRIAAPGARYIFVLHHDQSVVATSLRHEIAQFKLQRAYWKELGAFIEGNLDEKTYEERIREILEQMEEEIRSEVEALNSRMMPLLNTHKTMIKSVVTARMNKIALRYLEFVSLYAPSENKGDSSLRDWFPEHVLPRKEREDLERHFGTVFKSEQEIQEYLESRGFQIDSIKTHKLLGTDGFYLVEFHQDTPDSKPAGDEPGAPAGFVITDKTPRNLDGSIDAELVTVTGPFEESATDFKRLMNIAVLYYFLMVVLHVNSWFSLLPSPLIIAAMVALWRTFLHRKEVVYKGENGKFSSRPTTGKDFAFIFPNMMMGVYAPWWVAMYSGWIVVFLSVCFWPQLDWWSCIILIVSSLILLLVLAKDVPNRMAHIHRSWNKNLRPADKRTSFPGDPAGVVMPAPQSKPATNQVESVTSVAQILNNIQTRERKPSLDLDHMIPQFDSEKAALVHTFQHHKNVVAVVAVNEEGDVSKVDQAIQAASDPSIQDQTPVVCAVLNIDLDSSVAARVQKLVEAASKAGVAAAIVGEGRDINVNDGPELLYTTLFGMFANRFANNSKARDMLTALSNDIVDDKRVVLVGAPKTPYEPSKNLLSILFMTVRKAGRVLFINIGTILAAAKSA